MAYTSMRRSLGVVDGLVIAASSIAATSSIGIGMGLIAGVVGLHLPGIMLLGFLPVLGIAIGYAQLNRVEPNCGNGGDRLAHQPLAVLPLIALTFSVLASLQSGVIPTVRGMLAMGRDRTLGPVWTRIHPKYGTPAAGTVLVGLIAAAIALLSLVLPKIGQLISAAVNAIGIVVALYYALTAIAAAVRFRGLLRTDARRALLAVVVPGLSALLLLALGGTLCWNFARSTDHFALEAANGWFELSVSAAIVVSGLAVACWARWGRRSAYFRGGAGTDADDERLLDRADASPDAASRAAQENGAQPNKAQGSSSI